MTPKAGSIKERIHKLDLIKVKIFCSALSRALKDKLQVGGKYLQQTSDVGLFS